MVIFHSYVKLPEGNDHKIYKPLDFEVPYFQTQELRCTQFWDVFGQTHVVAKVPSNHSPHES